jgi:hypothetical protein
LPLIWVSALQPPRGSNIGRQKREARLGDYELLSGIEVDGTLRQFIEAKVLPGTGIQADAFWSGFSRLLRELTPENKRLLRPAPGRDRRAQ